jgi:hypothetical protein
MGYEVLVQRTGPRDIAIRKEAKVELMKASREQRAGMAGALIRYAAGGFAHLPARMRRIDEAWYPSGRARRRVQVAALTPTDVCAYGHNCSVHGRQTFFITGIDLRDASETRQRDVWTDAGDEALRVARWASQDGGSHDAVSASG